ncbi:hypothetical protein KL921_002800 [Ogataea angusta]|uniref:BCD1 alpha/beta domain-containing protein n=1 Tax=Pichia angusta TaxID=870730 RepID=A0AAN6I5D5_PICAN|nr:uncharacterized protein KL928_003036 [Ogataea angusta]KAG7810305.1 hypothetical protein KL921_002800 [Ogataea angusta]KAG7818035.1 hypothetical protein KL928_003036 [Ogataea angusta]KAG7824486.1 hypothetical protein KL909_001708 [Ogataea angusta]KAG7828943.1 hypothetical protein KL920_002736 [Ogataea angusta]KAG7834257.1 hypothetical protein KL943_003553 [Ogataea angusta]
MTNCSGKSDLTSNLVSYKSREQLSSKDVQRDYNLLLQISRKVELGKQEARCTKMLSRNSKHLNNRKQQQRNLLEAFSYYANKSGVHIIALPEGMLRKRLNRSYYDVERSLCCWTIEWVIINSRLDKMDTILSHNNHENQCLAKLLPRDIHVKIRQKFPAHISQSGPATEINSLISRSDNNPLASPLNGKEDEKQDNIGNTLHYFLRSEVNSDVYLSLREDMSIKTILKHRSVIEFPTIYLSIEPIVQDKIIVEQLIERNNDKDEVRLSTEEAISSDDEPPEETSIKHQLEN